MLLGPVITFAAVVGALLLTSLVGVPLAVRLAQPQSFRRRRVAGRVDHDTPAWTAASFEPLDLGPDPMRWPSETPWKATARKELPWPSETWDDPHFGRHRRAAGDLSAQADARYEAAQAERRERAAAEVPAAAPHPSQRRRAAASSDDVARVARQEMRQIRERATQLQGEVRSRVGTEVRDAAAAAAAKAAAQARQAVGERSDAVKKALEVLPEPAEIERLVAEAGLAGAVQEIMRRTGWDFKTAAQYLAKARRGR